MKKNGFTLIEVLVFVSIISVVFTVTALVATITIRNTKSAENKILATRYAEELVEWLRGQKEADWSAFTTSGVGTWCFNTESIPLYDQSSPYWGTSALFGSCSSNSYLTNSIFKREVIIQKDSSFDVNGRMLITITVKWSEGNNSFSVPINTVFAQFE